MRGDHLKIGDLVTHVLYGRGWVGVIVDFKYESEELKEKRKRKALVQLQPGTEHENFFKRSLRYEKLNDNLGYVSVHWLFRIREKNGNTGPSRGETPPSR